MLVSSGSKFNLLKTCKWDRGNLCSGDKIRGEMRHLVEVATHKLHTVAEMRQQDMLFMTFLDFHLLLVLYHYFCICIIHLFTKHISCMWDC